MQIGQPIPKNHCDSIFFGFVLLSHVSCLPFPVLISVNRLFSHLWQRSVLLWNSIGDFPHRLNQLVFAFPFHRCPVSEASVWPIYSWSGILLGSRQSPVVRADSTDNGRLIGQRISFIAHFTPLFKELFCHWWCFFFVCGTAKGENFPQTNLIPDGCIQTICSDDYFKWRASEFVGRQDLDRGMTWFHVIQ